MNEQEMKLSRFKVKTRILVAIRKYADKLFEEGKINRKNKKEIEKKLIYEWHRNWNTHPNIPDSVKQGFNLLYS